MYEKCVLFIFLVILTILSCSGFRIDNLAMTDISSSNNKRNFHHTSSSTLLENNKSILLDRILTDNNNNNRNRHRIRHHRQLRAQQAHYQRFENDPQPPSGLIHPQQHHQQQQHQNMDLLLLNNRKSERSSYQTKQFRHHSNNNNKNNNNHHNNNKHQYYPCQEQDATMKGYLADIVVIASVESMSPKRKANYSVIFRISEKLKNKTSLPIDERIQLNFTKHDTTWNCTNDNGIGKPPDIVQIDIKKAKHYILFLNSYGPHNYIAYGAPELIKQKRISSQLRRVLQPNFKPKNPEVVEFKKEPIKKKKNHSERQKLICKTKGLPIPRIIWKLNGEPLPHSAYKRLNYKKRRSTLIIKETSIDKPSVYECIAIGVDNKTASKAIKIGGATRTDITFSEPCSEPFKSNYCQNEGTCSYISDLKEYMCECPTGFTGKYCEAKTSSQPSMYPQTNNYSSSCTYGAMTKYYCNDSDSIENSSYIA